MKAYKCDRCGKYFEKYERIMTWLKEWDFPKTM